MVQVESVGSPLRSNNCGAIKDESNRRRGSWEQSNTWAKQGRQTVLSVHWEQKEILLGRYEITDVHPAVGRNWESEKNDRRWDLAVCNSDDGGGMCWFQAPFSKLSRPYAIMTQAICQTQKTPCGLPRPGVLAELCQQLGKQGTRLQASAATPFPYFGLY